MSRKKISPKLSVSMKWKRRRRQGWQGWVKHFIFAPYSISVSRTAENLSSIDYWELMLQNLLPLLVFLSLFHFPFASLRRALSTWLAPNLNVQKQRKQSVTEHFSILLMLQLFPGWFDNINCCPRCYWWADPSQSRSAQLRPRWIRPLAGPRPVGPALIQ